VNGVQALIIGDVHGCSRELRKLLAKAPAEQAYLVGDLYTKGPDPVGVWQLIRDRGLLCVRGNHDQRLIDAMEGRRPDDAHAAKVVEQLDAADPAWRDHLLALPFYREAHGWTIVHASVHPSGSLAKTKAHDFLYRRRWPADLPAHPHWWASYRGERRIVFGHDALRGLVEVRREGQRMIVGLDTGCVYGGKLTGLCLPDETLVSVKAKRAYKKV